MFTVSLPSIKELREVNSEVVADRLSLSISVFIRSICLMGAAIDELMLQNVPV